MRFCLIFGALAGFVGVALGAVGAHVLKGALSDKDLGIFETAVRYQVYHSLALLALFSLGGKVKESYLRLSGILMVAGILFFSGSLYMICLAQLRFFGALAPLGGLCLMAGWIVLAVAGFRKGTD